MQSSSILIVALFFGGFDGRGGGLGGLHQALLNVASALSKGFVWAMRNDDAALLLLLRFCCCCERVGVKRYHKFESITGPFF